MLAIEQINNKSRSCRRLWLAVTSDRINNHIKFHMCVTILFCFCCCSCFVSPLADSSGSIHLDCAFAIAVTWTFSVWRDIAYMAGYMPVLPKYMKQNHPMHITMPHCHVMRESNVLCTARIALFGRVLPSASHVCKIVYIGICVQCTRPLSMHSTAVFSTLHSQYFHSISIQMMWSEV